MIASEVFLLDDDATVLIALKRGLEVAGLKVRTWHSPSVFLAEHDDSIPGCLVVDYAMPEVNGLEIQRKLAERGCERSIVFITGHGDIPMSVDAMRAGAVSFLPKPVRLERLLAVVHEAIAKDAQARDARRRRVAAENRIDALTRREFEVLELVMAGKMNKQIANILGTSEKTIKVHRGRVMHKLHVRSVAELVLMSSLAGIAPRPDPFRCNP
jgi:FixJ family two-component response regulator